MRVDRYSQKWPLLLIPCQVSGPIVSPDAKLTKKILRQSLISGREDGGMGIPESSSTSHSSFLYLTLEGMYGEAVSVRAEALETEGMYEWVGTDLHKKKYADFFDQYMFSK